MMLFYMLYMAIDYFPSICLYVLDIYQAFSHKLIGKKAAV